MRPRGGLLSVTETCSVYGKHTRLGLELLSLGLGLLLSRLCTFNLLFFCCCLVTLRLRYGVRALTANRKFFSEVIPLSAIES